MQEDLSQYELLARYLSAGYIANRMGISLAYAYSRYAKDAPVGDFWLTVAVGIERAMMESFNQQFADPPTAPGVQ